MLPQRTDSEAAKRSLPAPYRPATKHPPNKKKDDPKKEVVHSNNHIIPLFPGLTRHSGRNDQLVNRFHQRFGSIFGFFAFGFFRAFFHGGRIGFGNSFGSFEVGNDEIKSTESIHILIIGVDEIHIQSYHIQSFVERGGETRGIIQPHIGFKNIAVSGDIVSIGSGAASGDHLLCVIKSGSVGIGSVFEIEFLISGKAEISGGGRAENGGITGGFISGSGSVFRGKFSGFQGIS